MLLLPPIVLDNWEDEFDKWIPEPEQHVVNVTRLRKWFFLCLFVVIVVVVCDLYLIDSFRISIIVSKQRQDLHQPPCNS